MLVYNYNYYCKDLVTRISETCDFLSRFCLKANADKILTARDIMIIGLLGDNIKLACKQLESESYDVDEMERCNKANEEYKRQRKEEQEEKTDEQNK